MYMWSLLRLLSLPGLLPSRQSSIPGAHNAVMYSSSMLYHRHRDGPWHDTPPAAIHVRSTPRPHQPPGYPAAQVAFSLRASGQLWPHCLSCFKVLAVSSRRGRAGRSLMSSPGRSRQRLLCGCCMHWLSHKTAIKIAVRHCKHCAPNHVPSGSLGCKFDQQVG